MNQTPKKYAAAGLALVVLAAVVALVWKPWHDEVPTGTAFRIGTEVVSVAELDARNDSLRALYGIQEPLAADALDDFRRQAAKSMAISLVLDRAIEDAQITVPTADLDTAMTSFISQNFAGDHDAFLDALGNVNTSEKVVRAEMERQIALRRMLKEVAGDVTVSDEEIAAAFAERKESLGQPVRREVSNIVVASKQEARQIRRKLDAGTDVAELARSSSLDQATREHGGDLGAVALAEFEPTVGPVVFEARAGEAYGPVEGGFGWNVGVVTKVVAPVRASLAKDGPKLREVLVAERSQALWSAWLEKRLRAADIRYEEPYRPTDPYDTSAWVSGQDGAASTEAQR